MRGLAALLLLAGPLAGQYREARAGDYVFAATAGDVRALWVNPAGLGAAYEASIGAEVLVDRSRTGDLAVTQLMAAFNSKGIAFGYRRDRYNDTLTGHTWRLGLGTPVGRVIAGASLTLHSNGDGPGQRGVALGAQLPLGRAVQVGAVVQHLGRPAVHDSLLDVEGTGGIAFIPLPGLRLDAQGTLVFADSATTRAFRAGLTAGTDRFRVPLAFELALALDDDLAPRRLTLGVTIGGRDRVGAMVSGARPGGTLVVDAVSVAGVATRIPD